jgi:hypothetical protein
MLINHLGLEAESGPDTARIWKKGLVEREGHLLGDGNATTALPGDFTIPSDAIRNSGKLEVTLSSLDLSTMQEGSLDEPMTPRSPVPGNRAIRACTASMTFVVRSPGGRAQSFNFGLSYNVHFVTAHPCIPSPHHKRILDTPIAPIRIPSPPPNSDSTKLGPHELYGGVYIPFSIILFQKSSTCESTNCKLHLLTDDSRPPTSQVIPL